MGCSDPKYPSEGPPRQVTVRGFWIDRHEVTNAEFGLFVQKTGYVTVAEKPIDWETLKLELPLGTPRPVDLRPGSLVFFQPSVPVSLDNPSAWWRWTPGANWRHPEGPASNLDGKANHPVVHVAFEDASAFATWAKKRLPTEAEWEYVASLGSRGGPYAWGSRELSTTSNEVANIWQGAFPVRNLCSDGYIGTAPVMSYPANHIGVFDLAGNVWEWCADYYHVDAYALAPSPVVDPKGPDRSFDPAEPKISKRVVRGGSFLCNKDYCEAYRVTARRGTASDTGLSHTGFRCVSDHPAPR